MYYRRHFRAWNIRRILVVTNWAVGRPSISLLTGGILYVIELVYDYLSGQRVEGIYQVQACGRVRDLNHMWCWNRLSGRMRRTTDSAVHVPVCRGTSQYMYNKPSSSDLGSNPIMWRWIVLDKCVEDSFVGFGYCQNRYAVVDSGIDTSTSVQSW